MNLKKDFEIQEKILLCVLIGMTLMVVLPLLYLGFFDYRSVDDFWYSMPGEGYRAEGKNFFQVLGLVWRDSVDSWKNVQGTLIATFTTRLLETYLSRNYYYLTPFIMIFCIAFSEYVLFRTVLHKMIGFSRIRTFCIYLVFFDLQILYLPVPVEALYWLCGAAYYTIYYSLGILLIALLLQEVYSLSEAELHKGKENKKGSNSFRSVVLRRSLILLLGLMVSLGNMITSLSLFCFYSLVMLYIYIVKHKSRLFLSISMVFYTMGTIANVFAPGNGIRVDAAGYMNPVEAIAESFAVAFGHLTLQLRLPFIYFFGVVIVILVIRGLHWQLTIKTAISEEKEPDTCGDKGVCKVRKNRFRYPLLILLLSFLMLVAQYVPSMYTLGIPGAGRIVNLQRYTMLYLIYGNLIYFTGWVCEKRFFMGQNEKKAQTRETGKEKSNPGMCLCRFPVALVLFAICGCLGLLSLYKCANKTITTVSAIYTIRRGEQKVYRQENEERIALMENSEAPEVELKLFEIKPYLIFYGDTLSDEDPLTDVYKYYYKKEKIHVIP